MAALPMPSRLTLLVFICLAFSNSAAAYRAAAPPLGPALSVGVRASNGSPITGNDPLDTSIAITASFVSGWLAHLTGKYGSAANGGVRFYNLDNEPMLWNSTHRDVHPAPTGYDEMKQRTLPYA